MDNSIERKLKKYARFDNEEDVIYFDEILHAISESADPKYIPLLMSVLDDYTEFDEVMFGIVHCLESYPKETYVPMLVMRNPEMLKKAPLWQERLVNRVFNEKSYFDIFKKNINVIPRSSMLELLDLVERESEHHRDLCEELRKELLVSNC